MVLDLFEESLVSKYSMFSSLILKSGLFLDNKVTLFSDKSTNVLSLKLILSKFISMLLFESVMNVLYRNVSINLLGDNNGFLKNSVPFKEPDI